MSIGFFNGEFIDIYKAVIPIEERGHQFGDGIYEVIKIIDSKPILLDEHLIRLENSASSILLELPYTIIEIKGIIMEGIHQSGLKNAEVYVQITRGVSPRNHLFPDVSASFTMTVKPSKEIPAQYYLQGISTITLRDERWANCHVKSLNLLPNVMAKQIAANSGSFEAIQVRDGKVTEGSSTNVFAVNNGIIYTTPLTSNILPGITRQAILQAAKYTQMKYLEENFTPEFLKEADEAFLTSTSVDILPIRSVDGKLIGNGNPGRITLELHQAFQRLYVTREVNK
ncbi:MULTISPECIES: D-amino-acid transaminase [Cytobacillus]|uniref:D-alanine aminotransferase n=1 Tax=Cytobacillus oceanisediminis TaxID=665099 RepID=A0ABX3CN80_9BACI|nr:MULTISPECIES: D-amino-acid transaminase [Cytobacillus]OHX44673.1 D-amino-acid transaminase [Cytobacillus oceanisediminis]